MSLSIRSHMTRAALLCSVVLLAPFAMADTPATPSPQPNTTVPAAAPAPSQTREDMRARRRADHEAFFSARLAALRAGLQLKPDQEALWTPVETAIRDFGKLRAARWAERDAGSADQSKSDASTPALRRQADRLIARGNAMKSLADATGPLLASLDADQKGRLPTLLDGLHPKRVLARAFMLEDHHDDHEAWRREAWHNGEQEHDGWGRGMRHEHWADRDDREHAGRDGDGPGVEHRHHHEWDGDHAERDFGRGGEDRERGDRPMHHHHDRDDDEQDRT